MINSQSPRFLRPAVPATGLYSTAFACRYGVAPRAAERLGHAVTIPGAQSGRQQSTDEFSHKVRPKC